MKKIIGVVLFISINLSTSAWAEVVLHLPEAVQVVAINGKNANEVNRITLPDGINQIAIRVVKELGRSFEEELEYSDVFVVTFKAVKTKLHLTTPLITSTRKIRAFNNDPRIQLQTSDDEIINSAVAKLIKKGLQLMRNYEQELAAFNKTNSPAAVQFPESQLQQKPAEPLSTDSNSKPEIQQPFNHQLDLTKKSQTQASKNKPGNNDSIMAEKMLKYWYQQADPTTRKQFRQWIGCVDGGS